MGKSLENYTVLIADDNDKARKAVRIILDSDPQFHVVSEASSGEAAIAKTVEHMPDLVLMDINMPGMNGFEATRMIKEEFPNVKVVFLSVSDDAIDLLDAIRYGAQGYLVKSLQPVDWVPYLYGIMDGDIPVSRVMAERLLGEFKLNKPESPGTTRNTSTNLTERERQILTLVSTGASNREIALQLFIAENTVKNHLKSIMAKLQIQNRVQLAIYAREHLQ